MTRWLPVLAVVLLLAAFWLAYLNDAPVTVRLTPTQTITAPMAGALLTAFGSGGLLVALIAGARATTRGWRNWRARRRAAQHARRAAAMKRAEELVWVGDYSGARAELERATPEAQEAARRALLLAESYLQEGDLPAARATVEEALKAHGDEPRLLVLLADIAERHGDEVTAMQALERAHPLLPESPRLARRRRDLYIRNRCWAEALALQSELLLRVRDATVLLDEERVQRGLRYELALKESDARRAASQLRALTREDASFLPAWVSAGDLYLQVGRAFAARRLWERGARYRPATVLLERIAALNARERHPERTTRLLRRLQRRHPDSTVVPLLLARHLLERGEFEETTRVLTGLSAAIADTPQAQLLWGELHRRQGNHDQAVAAFGRALGTERGLLGAFRCRSCERAADTWEALCPGCLAWGSFEVSTHG